MSSLRKKNGPELLTRALELALVPRALAPVNSRSSALAATAAFLLACGTAGCSTTSASPEREGTTAAVTATAPASDIPRIAGTSEPSRPPIAPSSEPTRLGGAVAVPAAPPSSIDVASPPPPHVTPQPNMPTPPGKMRAPSHDNATVF